MEMTISEDKDSAELRELLDDLVGPPGWRTDIERLIGEQVDRAALQPIPMVNGLDCPACGHPTLILGEGGYVTCSLEGCPNPDYAEALEAHTVAQIASIYTQELDPSKEYVLFSPKGVDPQDYVDVLSSNIKLIIRADAELVEVKDAIAHIMEQNQQ
jgi:hypothetical protein